MASKQVKLRFQVEPTSLKELEKILNKFKLTWDDKIFKSTDKLGGQLDKLSDRIFKLNERMAKQRLSQAQGTGTATGAGVQFDMDKFFDEFGKEISNVTDSMAKAADAISKLKVNVTGTSSSIGDEKAERDASTAAALVADGQRKIMQQKMRDDNRKVAMAMDHRLKQERLMTRHMMSMFGGGMVGGSLGLMLGQLGEGIGGKFKKAQATEEYAKTEEGQKQLEFQKAAQGSRNPLGNFGAGISSEWAEKGVTPEGLGKAGTSTARAKSWMGRRVEGAQTGDISKMFGGKKGMLMAGGALMGVGIMKKAISLGIESSPMMQQMLKLWKFGIMMIFRPIGDFFGFFLRPIFVMLLRKFIIPFYQEYLPLMQTMGMDLGEKVVNILSKLLWLGEGAKVKEDEFAEVSAVGKTITGEIQTPTEIAMEQAMLQSLIDNEGYWTEMFSKMDSIPAWVKEKFPQDAQFWKDWEDLIALQKKQIETPPETRQTGTLNDYVREEDATNLTKSINATIFAFQDLVKWVDEQVNGTGLDPNTGYVDVDPSTVPPWLGGTKDMSVTVNVETTQNNTINAATSDELREEMTSIAKDADENTKTWIEQWLANLGVK